MRKKETITINEKTYVIHQMAATDAVAVQLRLLKLMGGDLVKIFQQDADFFSSLSKLDTEEVKDLIVKLVSNTPLVTDIDGKPVDIDNDFTGSLMALYELLWYVLRTNYEDFFLGVQSKVGSLLGSTKKPKKKKQT